MSKTQAKHENKDFSPPADPWDLFSEWFTHASTFELSDPNAMTLATVSADGMPAARIVLMKGYDSMGLTFYTNQKSAKAEQLKKNAFAALCFHWKSLSRQIRIQGAVEFVSDQEADAYFVTRPRGSQIGAWASDQSRPLKSREELLERLMKFEEKFEGAPVPKPPHWGGYRLIPSTFEFWQEREFRLHDRFVYTLNDDKKAWHLERLFP